MEELLNKLRECFDPYCAEYQESTMEQKVEILRKIQSKGMSMHRVLMEYTYRYVDRKEPMNPLTVLPDGLATIVEYLLRK